MTWARGEQCSKGKNSTIQHVFKGGAQSTQQHLLNRHHHLFTETRLECTTRNRKLSGVVTKVELSLVWPFINILINKKEDTCL